EIDGVVAAPAELDGLALDGFARHALSLLQHPERPPRPQLLEVADEGTNTQHGERVAHVDGDGDAVELVERRLATSDLALVLDLVVNEERVVQDLERDGRVGGLRGRAAAMQALARRERPPRRG